jgi:uncharacterized membrane protein YebE (DUF533 family)
MMASRLAMCDMPMASMIVIVAVGALANTAYRRYSSGNSIAANIAPSSRSASVI